MPEQLAVLPEPLPLTPQSPEQNEKFLRGLTRFPEYPSDCIIDAPGFAYDQSIHYQATDVAEDVVWANETLDQTPEFNDFLLGLIGRVTERFPGDAQKWDSEFVSKNRDRNATLKDVSEAGAANCFIRGVTFVSILQQTGIEAKVIQGDWVETTRERVLGAYAASEEVEFKTASYSYGSGVRYLQGEEGEFHAFVLVRHEGKFYLADPALWVKNEDGSPQFPLSREVTEEELLSRDVAFELPNGKKRHYAFKGGRVFIEEPSTSTGEGQSRESRGLPPAV